jgi:hypothetical protein
MQINFQASLGKMAKKVGFQFVVKLQKLENIPSDWTLYTGTGIIESKKPAWRVIKLARPNDPLTLSLPNN